MFQQTLTYLYPSSANGFFLVQLTDHLIVIDDRIVLFPFSICLDVEDHPQGPVVSQSCSRWCHWSSSCPLVDSSVFHPQILESARSFFWNVLFFVVHLWFVYQSSVSLYSCAICCFLHFLFSFNMLYFRNFGLVRFLSKLLKHLI